MTNATLLENQPIAFQSADEFRAREGYVSDLRCGKDELDRIVGKYEFSEKEKLQCGLNGCNHWHWHGYVIRTTDGREGHCGQDCGHREFGVSFKEVEAVYRRIEEAQAKKDQLQRLVADRDLLLREARLLAAQVDASLAAVRGIVLEVSKDAGLDRAFRACLRDGGRILVEDEDSKRLRAAMGAASGKADLRTIGVVKGTGAVTLCSTVAGELRYQAIEPLVALSPESLAELSPKELDVKASSLRQLRQTVIRAQQFVSDARMFCAGENLRTVALLEHAVPKRARTARVTRILERLPRLAWVLEESCA